MTRKRTPKSAPTPQPAAPAKHFPIGPVLTVLCLLPAVYFFSLGKYLEMSTPGPFDSGAYIYSAHHLLEGARWGIEEQPTAQPATLMMNVIGVKLFGFSETGPEIIQMLLQLAALAMMFWALLKLWGRSAAVVAVTVAAFYLSAPHVAKYGNVKEQFMIAFMVIAASAWILYEVTGRKAFLFLTGAAAIWPYYFKPTGLSIVIALAGYLLYRTFTGTMTRKEMVRNSLGLIAGAAVGILPLAAFHLTQGRLDILFNSFPFFALYLLVIAVVLVYTARFLFRWVRQAHLLTKLRQVRAWIWMAGLGLIGLLLIGWTVVFYLFGDVAYFWNSLFFVKISQSAWFHLQDMLRRFLSYAGVNRGYLEGSRQEVSLAQQAPVVFRYYLSLAVPVLAGVLALLIVWGRQISQLLRKFKEANPAHRLAVLLTAWWLLDMAFVWISPRSYEEYYLPLCASGAVLAGYIAWLCKEGVLRSQAKPLYAVGSAVLLVVGIALAWPVYAGLTISPYNGQPYPAPAGQVSRERGYVQARQRVPGSQQGGWIKAGEYIRAHSRPEDTIYVWGWYPGIYVAAERMAPIPQAFESNMHTMAPVTLATIIRNMVNRFEANPPKFIVDSRKRHFPFDRLPLELWPHNALQDFLPNHPQAIEDYEQKYAELLAQQFNADEARRFEAMKPFRDFVMTHYRRVGVFGGIAQGHVLFEYKGTLPTNTPAQEEQAQTTEAQ